mgnify:CR=1 FL=1
MRVNNLKFLLIFSIFLFFITLTIYKFKWEIYHSLPNYFKSILLVITNNKNYSHLMNDYNVVFLPETQEIKLDFEKIKIINDQDNIGYKGFFLDISSQDIFISSKKGNFFKLNVNNLHKSKLKKIASSQKFNLILDIFILDNYIYVSNVTSENKCNYLNIHLAKIDNSLDFSLFKKFKECGKEVIRGGRIQEFLFNDDKGLLITTGDLKKDFPNQLPQDDNSIFGKVLFINLNTKDYFIYSKGHRNAQGLAVKKNIILSSEHGPKGGDEINNIMFKKNYGWPKASYGVSYDNLRNYQKSHKENSYEEPIKVFVPSIGISEIMFLPDTFHKKWENNVLITSLADKSIYRAKFEDSTFTKILYLEKIYIGERIRDIKYIYDKNIIILALEDSGSLGILKIDEQR